MNESRNLVRHIIVDVFNDVLSLQEKYLNDHGISLSISEVHTLEAVENAGENNRMSDIAKSLNITLSTLSINIKRLINKGYVIRTVDKIDRRIVRLSVSDKAIDVLKVHDRFHEELVDSFFDDLNIGEDLIFIESLEKIDQHLRKLIDKLSKPK